MTYISEGIRRQVIERANGCCEYCLIHQKDSLYVHEVDHIIPMKHRGQTTLSNLCLACLECNRNKGSDFGSFDPESGDITQLYDPRNNAWNEHFVLEGVVIKPLTSEGRVTVFVLKLNDAFRLRTRQALFETGHYPPPNVPKRTT